MKIYSVVVTFNGVAYVDKCIPSVINQTQVIVIDNASSDGTADYVEANYPAVSLVRSDTNLGFGKANNVGLKMALEAEADYVLLLNQDAWLHEGSIEALIDVASRNKEYGVISPLHLNGSGSALDYKFAAYIAKRSSRELVSELYTREFSKEVYEVKFVNAAAWLIPRRTLEVVGGFNPVFFHYGEDDNYVSRLQYHGFKFGVAPEAVVYHDREMRELTEDEKIRAARKNLMVKVSAPNSLSRYSEYKWSVYKNLAKNLALLRLGSVARGISDFRKYRRMRKDVWKTSMNALTPGRTYLE